MADKILSAVFKATDSISDDLDSIASSADEVSDSLNAAATAAEEYAEAADDAADSTDDLSSSLDSIFESAAQATAGLEGVQEAAEEAGETTKTSAVSAAGYGGALDYLGSAAAESVAPQIATASAIGLVGEQADEATEEVIEYASSLSLISGVSLGGLSPSIPDIGGVSTPDIDISQPEINLSTPDIDTPSYSGPSIGDILGGGGGGEIDTGGLSMEEFEERLTGIMSALADMPDISFEAESAAELADSLAEAKSEARSLVGLLSLSDINIADVGSVGELTSKLDGAGDEAEALAAELRDSSGATRDFLNTALDASDGMEELAENLNRTSAHATETADDIEKLADETGGMIDEVIAASASLHTLAEAVDEYGDEASESIDETLSLSNALETLGLSGSTAYLQLGPLATRISSISKAALPLIGVVGALASAVAALGTAAVGAGAAMGGILAGGLMVLAEQAAARKEAMLAASGKQLSPEQANVTMAEGMDIVRENIQDQLKQATAPLRTPQFAKFTLGVIESAMTVIHDFSVFAANLAPALMRVADAVMEVYNAVAPEIWSQLTKTVLAFLPVIQKLITGALRALPGILKFIRKRGKELIPLLIEFGSELADVIGPLIEIGSNILQVVLPALTFFLRILEPILEAVSWLTGGLEVLGSIFTAIPEPILNTAAALFSVAYAISKISGLLSFFGIISSGVSVLGALGSMASYASAAISAIGSAIVGVAAIIGWPITLLIALGAAIAGVITYFHAWDDIMNIISGTISALVGAIDWVLGGIADFITWIASLVGLGEEVRWFFQSVDYWVRRLAGALRILTDAWNAAAGFFDWAAGSVDEWFSRATDNVPGQTPTKKKNREGGGKGGKGEGDGDPFPEAQQKPPGKYPKVDTGGGIYRGGSGGGTTVNNVEITAPKNAQAYHIRSIVRQELARMNEQQRQRTNTTN